nr:hypothetical protein [Plantibacter sp. VKM Ac-2876]
MRRYFVGAEQVRAALVDGALKHLLDEWFELGAFSDNSRCGECPERSGADVESAESSSTRRRASVSIDDRPPREQIDVEIIEVARHRCRWRSLLGQFRVEFDDLVPDQVQPVRFVDCGRLRGARVCVGPLVDGGQVLRRWFSAGVFEPPLIEPVGAVPLDLTRPLRQRPHDVSELLDLAVIADTETPPGEGGDPFRVRPRGEVALRVDDGLETQRHSGVDVAPAPVLSQHLDVEPQVPVLVGIKCARPRVAEFYDLDTRQRHAAVAGFPTTRIELKLPGEDYAFAEAILECVVRCRDLRIEDRSNGERFRRVDGGVEEQICSR